MSVSATGLVRNSPLVSLGVVAIIFGILPLFASSYQTGIATEILIFALLAMSIDILAGMPAERRWGMALFSGPRPKS